MDSRFLTVFTIILTFDLSSAYTSVTPIIDCPPNEAYATCGSACPPSCQDKKISPCTLQCVRGCVCQEGFIREGPGGRCVPRSCENVPICKEDEIFSTCASLCPRTCNDTGTRACPALCVTGCVCPEYHIRERESGRCIPEVSCKTKCDEHEEYKECGTMCPRTCSQPVRVCQRKCVRGCFCKDGYILDDNTKKCVETRSCLKYST